MKGFTGSVTARLLAGTLVALCALFAPVAAQAAATHPFLSALNGAISPSGEFNKACGVAVDSKGDVYVANSAKGAIDIFDSSGGFLTQIIDANSPCALAVDSEGKVYAVDTATGDVVRYAPQGGSYPPVSGQAFESPMTVESGGEAKGVAVDPATDGFYVSTATRINAYESDGASLAVDEVQLVFPANLATGGTFTLSFRGAETTAIPLHAAASQVQSAVEALSTIDAGGVAVEGLGNGSTEAYRVTFEGPLSQKNVPALVGNGTGLTVSEGNPFVSIETQTQGFSGVLGEGALHHAAGIGVWGAAGYVYAADEGGTVFVFGSPTSGRGEQVVTEITGEGRPGGTYTALAQAQIAVDQTNGHVLVFDAEEGTVDEFESSGPFVSQITHSFTSAGPSAVAIDPSEDASSQRIYVTSGVGFGSQVFSFGPLLTPTHRQLIALEPDATETPTGEFKNNRGVAVDSRGDVYVVNAGSSSVDVFAPEGEGLKFSTSVTVSSHAEGIAVDSECNIYIGEESQTIDAGKVIKYPIKSACQLNFGSPEYGSPEVVDSEYVSVGPAGGIAVDRKDDHLFVAHYNEVREYGSATEGNPLLRGGIDGGLASPGQFVGLAVDEKSGEVFVSAAHEVLGLQPATNELLVKISGAGLSKMPDGPLPSEGAFNLALDQSNGHVYVMREMGGAIYEFESSGAYVTTIQRPGPANPSFTATAELAVDNFSGAHAGAVFVSGGTSGSKEVNVYSAARYGEPPVAATAPSSQLDPAGGTATLNGTIDPVGFPVSVCEFEYVAKDKEEFVATGFAGATKQPCAEPGSAVGSGESPIPVHTQLTGLAGSRYYYRLHTANQFGEAEGEAERFGAPELAQEANPETLYSEAVLTGKLNPVGLDTTYHCEYGLTIAYGAVTPGTSIYGSGESEARCALFGLVQGSTYHYRVVAVNSWGSTEGEDKIFTTLTEATQECPNEAVRRGASAGLPDCRAYELLTPDLGEIYPADLRARTANVNNEHIASGVFPGPLASPDGEELVFYGEGAPPGFAGNGTREAYAARRTATGWADTLAGPTPAQMESSQPLGSTPNQAYSFWENLLSGGTDFQSLLRLPDGSFQPVGLGQGSLIDWHALSRYVTGDGSHVIFTSGAHLTSGAPPAGKEAIYDRAVDGVAQLISTPPPDAPSAVQGEFEQESALYVGSSADGSTVAFKVGSTLYVHRAGTTGEAASGQLAFGGLSSNGSRLFYVALGSTAFRGEAFAFDTDSATTTAIGSGGESVLVNVSSDGSHVYFASRAVLDPGQPNDRGEEAQSGKENLYVWTGAGGVVFIGTVAAADIEEETSSGGFEATRLGSWVKGTGPSFVFGPALDPSRATPDGRELAFVSRANLTSYNAEGQPEVYLYGSGEGVRCVSCHLLSRPTAGATLEFIAENDHGQQRKALDFATSTTLIPNLSADGSTVFFETTEGLVPQDGNGVRDVYEWPQGEVSLISAGTGTAQSLLVGASEDGRDVFFLTFDTLSAADTDGGGVSIYDARVNGGFATEADVPCQGEACRSGKLGPPSGLNPPGTATLEGPGNLPSSHPCQARRHTAKKKGKAACGAKKKESKHQRNHHVKHRKKAARGHGRKAR